VTVLATAILQCLLVQRCSAQAHPPPPPLQVVVKSLVPFVITDAGQPRGSSIDVLKEVASRAGFTYKLREVANVEAQLDAIRSGQADLAIAGISITSEREATVDFSHPMYNSGLQILVRDTESRSTTDKITSVVFSPGLRHLVALLLAVIVVVAHVVWLWRSGETRISRPGTCEASGKGAGGRR
jgi:polar amino acid transport system substrate-binding protein